jgi:long-chain fatty acid transport protein
MRSSRYFHAACFCVLLVPVAAAANGLYVPGVGSRASAMGGAFVGLADDFSAVYWNPAGITQIKGMEVTGSIHDLVTLASRDGSRFFDGTPGAEDEYRMGFASIGVTTESQNRIAPGFFFYTDPGPMRGIVDKVGFAVYTLSDYGAKWDGDDVLAQEDLLGGGFDAALLTSELFGSGMYDYEARVKSYVASPVVAREVIPGLSIGLAANIVYSHYTVSDVALGEVSQFVPFPDPTPDAWVLLLLPVQATDDVTGWGYGATLGALYRLDNQISVGLTVRSPVAMAYEGTHRHDSVEFPLDEEGNIITLDKSYDLDFEIRYPMWVGLGVGYRDFLFDGLTMTADLQWTRWSNLSGVYRNIDWGIDPFRDEFLNEFNLERSDFENTVMKWKDTLEFALGFDYRLGRSISVNLGYRNSPSPVRDDTYSFVMPSSDSNAIGLGVSYRQDFWRVAAALEYMAGDSMELRRTFDINNGKHLTDLLVPSLSLTYAF